MWGKEGRGNGRFKGGEKWVGLRVGKGGGLKGWGENRGDLGWEQGGGLRVGKRG